MQPPSGTVTFLFTDIEGSTGHWQKQPESMRPALARHNAILQQAIESRNGYVFKTIGDAYCAAFSQASDALNAAVDAQLSFIQQDDPTHLLLRVRMALHTGEAACEEGDYFGLPLSQVARLLESAHGGQILLTRVMAGLLSSRPEGVRLRSLGSHTLRSLHEPTEILQVLHTELPADFPPIRSTDTVPNNLPRELSKFIGRETQLDEVKRRLESNRLVTLTGEGGCGKTRLAIQAASESLYQHEDGVWLAELAAVEDSSLIAQSIATAVGISPDSGIPLMDALREHFATRKSLLVLDNCEHLVDGCASLAETLLRSSPGLRILATSREELRISGEGVYRVPTMKVPDARRPPNARELMQLESVRLFVDRAAQGDVRFELTEQNAAAVAGICRAVEGIPLAVELAAARTKALSPEMLLDRLQTSGYFPLLTGGRRTAMARQQTLKATIDWSFALLTEKERLLQARLSVFHGGSTLLAAEAVCQGDSIEEWEIPDLLTGLVEKSLIRREGDRFLLLESIRQYGIERLEQSGEAELLRARHRDYFLKLAEESKEQIQGPDQKRWLELLESEHNNLRAALRFSTEAEVRLRIAFAIHRFWLVRGYIEEGRNWLDGVLNEPDGISEELMAGALNSSGILARAAGDLSVARARFERSLDRYRELGDENKAARILINLGIVAAEMNDSDEAVKYLRQSLDTFVKLKDSRHVAFAQANLGSMYLKLGDPSSAEPLLRESRDAFHSLGDSASEARVIESLGRAALISHDYPKAIDYFQQSIKQLGSLHDTTGMSGIAIGMAQAINGLGRPAAAAQLLGAAWAVAASTGVPMPVPDLEEYESLSTVVRRLLGSDFDALWHTGYLNSNREINRPVEYYIPNVEKEAE